jgi:hypothetical protein
MSRNNQELHHPPHTSFRKLNYIVAVTLLFWFAPALANPPYDLPICSIQGSGFSSPFLGWTVRTQGVVILDLDQASQRGFFLQAINCDNHLSTSDGIFVYLGERIDVVSASDRVEVIGCSRMVIHCQPLLS